MVRFLLTAAGLVIVGIIAVKVLLWSLGFVIPLLILGVIGYIVLHLVGKLAGGNDKYLPR